MGVSDAGPALRAYDLWAIKPQTWAAIALS